MDLGLKGRVALVTGSYRGTGAGIARVLAREGAEVLVHGFKPGEADGTADEITAAGGLARPVIGDITTDEGASRVAMAAGDVDILINNYGVAERGSWETTDSAAWIAIYEKNTLSAARMIRHLTPAMKAKGWGRVVQIGTIGSTRPGERMPHYYASKGALATLTVSLAQSLARTGVTVNTVSPGLIRTKEVEAAYRKMAGEKDWGDEWSTIERHIVEEFFPNATGRVATTEEVGAAVAFLCSAHAAMINGQNLRIDGGGVLVVS